MKLSAIWSLLKQRKRVAVHRGEDTQWVGDGYASYPIYSLPDLNTVLREKQESADRQIVEYKRLLKSAISEWNFVCEWGDCRSNCEWYENGKCTQEWSGKAEALALIGDDGDTNG